MRILLVDDDPDMLALLEHYLAPFGEVVRCPDGACALETFRQALDTGAPFQLVCLDIRMLGMGGQQVLLALRRAEQGAGVGAAQRARIVMTTGIAERAHVLRALAAGCDGYLLKPFSRDDLLTRIAAMGIALPAPAAEGPSTVPAGRPG
jgi:two-component system chemotaxis response regulator CheY